MFCPGSLSVGVCCLMLHFLLFPAFQKVVCQYYFLEVCHHALIKMEIERIAAAIVFSAWQLT